MTYWGDGIPSRSLDAFGTPLTADAFGRLRVSMPLTIFDSKQVFSDQSLAFSTSVAGGAAIVYSANRASSNLNVTGAGQTAIRQTRRYFNYQPGKSQFIFATFVFGALVAGVTRRVGYFDSANGLFLQLADSTTSFVVRSDVVPPSESVVAQAAWNLDKLDGTGPSKITLDITKAQILFIQFEWLGVGSATLGFVIDGKFVPAHQFDHSNVATSVYMRSPNLPVRYEISSTGGTATLESICCSVASEGGHDPVGFTRSADRGIAAKTINFAAMELVLAVRLTSGAPGNRASVQPRRVDLINLTNADSRWALILYTAANFALQVGGVSVFQAIPNSPVEFDVNLTAAASRVIALGANGRPTNGTLLASGYTSDDNNGISLPIDNILWLGSDIAGTTDVLVLGAQPTAANEDYVGSINWFELS